jgi:16S rRNA pseudouridine516 synthase
MDRILQSQGFGTRKWCRHLVTNGDVTVGGATVEDYREVFETEGLQFCVFGDEWLFRKHVYVALNKPPDYECSRKPSHHPGVLALLPEQFGWREIQPVGRLDHDTTGLLLLSDDGAFIHAQSSPRRHVPKRYLATTAEPVNQGLIEHLLAGVQLHDETLPLAAVECRQQGSHQVAIVVEQGKYHQVKRMLSAAGNHCTALKRVAIGALTLEALDLAEGEWCYLDHAELALVGLPVRVRG